MNKENNFLRILVSPDSFFTSAHRPDTKVMNYGCGRRKLSGQIGVDISNNTDADYVVAPGSTLPFSDNSFDLIVSRFVLEHIHDVGQLLNELSRVLKPGGLFRFCVPHALSIDMYDDPTHCHFYTLRTMNYFTGVSAVHYTTSEFSRATPYLRLTLGWPRWRIIRYPANIILGALGLAAPNFGENLLKLPFITGTLFFELEKRS